MEYLKIENGIITAHYAGDMVDEDCIPLDGEFWGCVGEPVEWYDEHWNRIDDMTLYATGRRKIPNGMRINDDGTSLVEMTDDEKVLAGLKPVPFGQKIEDGRLVNKTSREMWLDGDITTEDYRQSKRMERDSLLSSTDKYMISDFPVDEEYRERIRLYRQELRDITQSAEWPDMDIPQMPKKKG